MSNATTAAPDEAVQAVNPVPIRPAPDMPTLQRNLDEAVAANEASVASTKEALARNDITAAFTAAQVWQSNFEDIEGTKPRGGGPIAKAKAAITRATFEARSDERMAESDKIKAMGAAIAEAVDVKRLVDLLITGFSVAFNADGTVLVNVSTKVLDKSTPRSPGGKTPGTVGGGATEIHYNGETMNSREFLLKYGGQEGDDAVGRVTKGDPRYWEANGLKSNPGFDAARKTLAKKLGAEIMKGGVPVEL